MRGRDDADDAGRTALDEDDDQRSSAASPPVLGLGRRFEPIRGTLRAWAGESRQVERCSARSAEPQCDGLGAAQPDELGADRVGQRAGVSSRGQHLAELVLGEHRVGLAPGFLVDPPELGLERGDPGRRLVQVHRPAPAPAVSPNGRLRSDLRIDDQRPKQEDARYGTRIEMPDGTWTKP